MESPIETNYDRRTNISLALSTGVLFGCSFPPFPLGILASVSLVPLLLAIERLHSLRAQFLYSYISFFAASCIALYWVGGFTHGKDPFLMMAGGLVLLWEPVFFGVIVLTYAFVRRNFGLVVGLLSLPFIWVTYEWLYALGEFAFPWLTMGNSQTFQLEKIQFADVTGVYGISFWLLLLNVLSFGFILLATRPGGTSRVRNSAMICAAILLVYIAPDFYRPSPALARAAKNSGRRLTVGIVQPNIDPWDKWEASKTLSARWDQVQKYLSVTRNQVREGAQMSVWPETAILFDLPREGREMTQLGETLDSLNVSLISGYINYRYYEDGKAPATSSIIRGTSIHYDSYNSILFLEPGSWQVQSYDKMRLVPFAERIPYASAIPFLIEPLRWGVGVSNWGIGTDSTVFKDRIHRDQFLAMVCYESIFPEFVGSFVRRGAEFLVFITNDSWWGNTSGARQHCQYAVLRAIENRRWVVRCANGGISCFIDPYGIMVDKTSMYTEASIVRTIQPLDEQTFYTRHGDWFARVCGVISAAFVFTALMNLLRSLIMKDHHTYG